MISRRTVIGLLIVGQIAIVDANQSIESISALTTQEDVSSAIEDGPTTLADTAPIEHDAGNFKGDNAAPVLDEELAAEVQASKNTLPAVGYVPKEARQDGQFNLVAESANEADQLYQKGALLESKKQYEGALKTVQRILLIEPDHPGALLARGRLLVKTQQYSAARASLASITASRTDDWRPWFWLGTAHLMMNELTPAEEAFDEALARNSDIAESWLHRALVAQQRGDWQVALQLLSIANEISPEHPLVLLNVAMCREALGYQDEAVDGYRRFLAQSHRAEVSKLLRFEVINHLTADAVASTLPEVQREVESTSDRELSEQADIVVNNFNEIPITTSPVHP